MPEIIVGSPPKSFISRTLRSFHVEDIVKTNDCPLAERDRAEGAGVKYRRIEGRFARGIPNKNSLKATRSKFEIER